MYQLADYYEDDLVKKMLLSHKLSQSIDIKVHYQYIWVFNNTKN